MWSLNLKNFYRSIKQDWIFLLALAIGFLLRTLNPTFGSLSLYVSNDESIAHLSAFNMIAEKTPVSIANYTPLGAYVQIPFLILSFFAMKVLGYVNSVSDFELFVLTHEGYFLFIPRLISGMFGTLTILVIYKLTKELFGERKTAIIAAFLSAVSFNLVHISHFGRPWSAALFFIILAVYFSVKKRAFAAYISIALSYGFHQVGLLFFPLIFLITAEKRWFKTFMNFSTCLLLIVLFSSLTLKTGFVESIKNSQSFIRSNVLITDFLAENFNFFESLVKTFNHNLSYYFISNLMATDGIIFFFGVLGIIKTFGENTLRKRVIIYVFLFFIFASLFFIPVLRYLLPILLLLIPFAAYAITFIFKKYNYLIFVLLALASVNAVWWNMLYLRTPTFIQVREWINENVSSEVPIAYIGGRYQSFVPNKNSIKNTQMYNQNYHKTLYSILDDNGLDNVRNIIYVSNYPGKDKKEQLQNATYNYPVEYVIDYYIDPNERLLNLMPEDFELIREFNPTSDNVQTGIAEPLFDASWNFPINDNRAKVSMYSLHDTGPYVEVLKVKDY